MNFGLVQTGFLLALIGLAIPVIIHFTFRTRPRTVDLGSIKFLRDILERSRNRKKVMRWLLMSLRMACIALLALLFARPFLTDRARGGADRFVAILIDDSASMRLRQDGQELLDRALADARQLLAEADDDTRIEVAFFNEHVEPLASVSGRDGGDGSNSPPPWTIQSLRDSLQSRQASHAVTDYAAALRWASDVCTKAAARQKEVHLFTDLQQSGLAWSEAQAVPRDVVFHVHDLGRNLVNNVAVTTAEPSRLLLRPGETTDVTVSVYNAGPFTLDDLPVVLELRQENRPISMQERIKLAAGAVEEIRFELPALAQGFWQGAVSLEILDDLAFDNVRHLAVMAAPPWRVLLVDGDPHEAAYLSETYFLDLALRLAPRGDRLDTSPYAAETVNLADTKLPDLAGTSVVILANVAELPEQDVAQLARFVNGGGNLIVFGGERLSAEGCGALTEAGLIPGALREHRLAGDLPFRLREWDGEHSVFRPFDDPQHGDLRGLTFRGYTPLAPRDDATVLAEFFDATPALVERPLGEGRVIWFASSCDLIWGDWAKGPLFVPLVHRMLGYLTGLNEAGRSARCSSATAPARATHGRRAYFNKVATGRSSTSIPASPIPSGAPRPTSSTALAWRSSPPATRQRWSRPPSNPMRCNFDKTRFGIG
jgi:hypothetical protein